MTERLAELKERLRIQELPEDTLRTALTHRSRDRYGSNERLELLGDAVLDLAVIDILLSTHPEASEGELSVLRSQLVREDTLADVAREHDLGAHLRLSRGEAASGGADKPSLLADATEAIIGATFLECGYDEAHLLVSRLLGERIGSASGRDDAKTALQERASEMGLPAPTYTHERQGPEHAPTFEAEVTVGSRAHGSGRGTSRKRAEQEAAREALQQLRSRWDQA